MYAHFYTKQGAKVRKINESAAILLHFFCKNTKIAEKLQKNRNRLWATFFAVIMAANPPFNIN